MPTFIDRYEVGRLRDEGAQVVEVLPAKVYDREHIPGAVNVPLKSLDADAPVQLDPNRPVVVYCSSFT